jgi:hypothetical protein
MIVVCIGLGDTHLGDRMLFEVTSGTMTGLKKAAIRTTPSIKDRLFLLQVFISSSRDPWD